MMERNPPPSHQEEGLELDDDEPGQADGLELDDDDDDDEPGRANGLELDDDDDEPGQANAMEDELEDDADSDDDGPEKRFSPREIEKHNTSQDCWLIIGNPDNGGRKVYDVTKFLDEHPGGAAVMVDVGGQDVTEFFEDIGHSPEARGRMAEYYIGNVAGDRYRKRRIKKWVLAVVSNNVDTLRKLYQKDDSLNSTIILDGKMALTYAAERGYFDTVRELLDMAHGRVNIRDANQALRFAALYGNCDAVAILLKVQGIWVNEKDEVLGSTALILAAGAGHHAIVRALLMVDGLDLNATNPNGETALMLADQMGYIDIVKTLLGFELTKCPTWTTRLMLCAGHACIKTLNLLFETGEEGFDGASVDLEDDEGRTALTHALEYSGPKEKDLVATIRFLIDQGANVNDTSLEDTYSAMHAFVKHGDLEDIKLLIEKGFDLNQTFQNFYGSPQRAEICPSGGSPYTVDILAKYWKFETKYEFLRAARYFHAHRKDPGEEALKLRQVIHSIVRFPEFEDDFRRIFNDQDLQDPKDPMLDWEDEYGRSVLNVACRECRSVTLYKRRYHVNPIAQHKSKTCSVFFALDYGDDGEKHAVALKFMKNQRDFDREVMQRISAKLDDHNHVVPLLGNHIIEGNSIWEKGYYGCLVMPRGEKNLANIIESENVAGVDYARIWIMSKDICEAIEYLHKQSVIHGDIKPRNIVRIKNDLKLIDFDAAAMKGKVLSWKSSTGYISPERAKINFKPRKSLEELDNAIEQMEEQVKALSQRASPPEGLTKTDVEGLIQEKKSHIQQLENDKHSLMQGGISETGELTADFLTDIWSFGVVMYQLFAGVPLFKTDAWDNISDKADKHLLKDWKGLNKAQLKLVLRDEDEDHRKEAIDVLQACLVTESNGRFASMTRLRKMPWFQKSAASNQIKGLREDIVDMYKDLKRSVATLQESVDLLPETLMKCSQIVCPYLFQIVTKAEFEKQRTLAVAQLNASLSKEDAFISKAEHAISFLNKAKQVLGFVAKVHEEGGKVMVGKDIEEKLVNTLFGAEVEVSYLQLLCGKTLRPVISYEIHKKTFPGGVHQAANLFAVGCRVGMALGSVYNITATTIGILGYKLPKIPGAAMDKAKEFTAKVKDVRDGMADSDDAKGLSRKLEKGMNAMELETLGKLLDGLQIVQLDGEYREQELREKRWDDAMTKDFVSKSGKRIPVFVSIHDASKITPPMDQNSDATAKQVVQSLPPFAPPNPPPAGPSSGHHADDVFKEDIVVLEARISELETKNAELEKQVHDFSPQEAEADGVMSTDALAALNEKMDLLLKEKKKSVFSRLKCIVGGKH